jgi:hypothetical protein
MLVVCFRVRVARRLASCVRVLGPVYLINWIDVAPFKLNTMTRSSPAGSQKKMALAFAEEGNLSHVHVLFAKVMNIHKYFM